MMDDMPLVLTSKEAIEHIAEHYGISSLYGLAAALSDEDLTVQPIQISNYMNGTRMSKKVADRVFAVYDIIISDVYTPGVFQR